MGAYFLSNQYKNMAETDHVYCVFLDVYPLSRIKLKVALSDPSRESGNQ